jgi:hypothetical protein
LFGKDTTGAVIVELYKFEILLIVLGGAILCFNPEYYGRITAGAVLFKYSFKEVLESSPLAR